MEADTTVTLYNFYGWLHTNRKRVLAGAIVVVVVAAVTSLWIWHNNQNEAVANQELLDAASVSGMTGLEEHARRDALLKINQEYPGTIAGANAQLLAAKASFLEGKYADARQGFSKFVSDHPGHDLIPQAQVGIAASFEADGQLSEAVGKYKEIAAIYATDANIANPVKLTLGRLSEAQNKPEVAVTFYQELAHINNPYDPWVAEAAERLRLLLAKHPELDKSATSNPYQPSLMNPSPAELQLSPPPASPDSAPAPAAAPKTDQSSPGMPLTTNLAPAAKP
jgi:predicted negative regulator of RcsB-dependent stress response